MARTTTRKKKSSKTTASGGKKGSVVSINMKGVEGRKAGRRYKPGDYAVKIVKVEQGVSSKKKTPQISFTLAFTDGKYKGKQIMYDCYLTPDAMWRLRNTLEALGTEVPNKAYKLDLRKLKNLEMAVTIDNEEYEQKIRSRVIDTFPLSELEDLEDEDDEDEDEDEDEDDDEDEDEDDEDEDEDEDDDDDDEDDDLEEVDLDDDEDEDE